MLKPYHTALRIPRFLLPDRFVKKETVKGIKGKTQGVTNAINPPVKPSKNIVKKRFVFCIIIATWINRISYINGSNLDS